MNPVPAVRIVDLSDLPRAEMCCSMAEVVMVGATVMVVYEFVAPGRKPGTIGEYAVVRFDRCSRVTAGGPNDEARLNHPCSEFGDLWAAQEVVNSPFIAQVHELCNKDGADAPPDTTTRHFVFALKEGTIDVFANSYRLVGRFPDDRAAWCAAMRELGKM